MYCVADTLRQYPSSWMCISEFHSLPIIKPPPLTIGYVQEDNLRQVKNLDEDLRRKLSLKCFNDEDSTTTTTTTRRITSNIATRNKTNDRKTSISNIVTAKEIVLRRCGQTEILSFKECYPDSVLRNCQKIGEGVYGEVFLYRCLQSPPPQQILTSSIEQIEKQQYSNGNTCCTSVMKIIPIEGDQIVNGEKQKKYEEILSEIIITMELSNLRNNTKNSTSCFTQVKKIACTRGQYPDRLIELWDLYDETKGSENDSPQMFTSNQTYIVLELANGGQDLESFVFHNAAQAYAMFKQTACALAVAETELKFEHRDLHWGNILISRIDNKIQPTIEFRLNGKEIDVETNGIQVTLIDFTLSRIEFDGVVIFNDLSVDDELFMAKGDYQFDIYRLMKEHNGNKWHNFKPFSNVLWLHYILDKVQHLRYKNPRSKVHKEYLRKLKQFKDEILNYASVTNFIRDKFF